ncbi:MAG TPA: NCS2 family permease, partial [Nocardioides sp.]|nr:NCS2 family permease [Nocardioides sp.]
MSDQTQTERQRPQGSGLDGYFRISQRGSTVGREVRGGVVTFLTMAYIIVLNPLILGFVPDSTGAFLGGGAEPGSGIPAIAAGTALVAGVLTIAMGGFANFPLALATGLGLNAFVANTIARQSTWGAAMGLVVLEGIVILVLVLTGFRKAVFHAVPQQLKVAISVGIGLFIALIGFVDARVVTRIPDAFQTTVPVQLGADGHLGGWPVLVFCLGLALMIALWVRKVRGAILISILVTTVVAVVVEAIGELGAASADNPKGWSLSVPTLSGDVVGLPSFDTLGEVDLFGAFGSAGTGVLAALL